MKHDLRRGIILITYAVLLFLGVYNWRVIGQAVGGVVSLITPFLYGFVLAYLLNGPYVFFRDRVYAGVNRSRRHMPQKAAGLLALITSYLLVFLVLALIFSIVLPQLGASVRQLGENFTGYLESLTKLLEEKATQMGTSVEAVKRLEEDIRGFVQNINFDSMGKALTVIFPHVLSITKGVTTGVYNWIIGLVVSIYLLAGKEKLLRQLQKLVRVCIPERFLGKVLEIATLTNSTFGKYIIGRIINSSIILVLCFIGMTIFQMPYALLISVIVGVTDIIPIFGPFIGAIPSAFILLMVDPIKGLWFIIFIIVLQQVDGNIIGPRVVGNSIGLSGIWVMFGVIVGGGQFGVLGMIVGVPVLAVIYTVLGGWVNKKMKKKEEASAVAEGVPAAPKELVKEEGNE